MALVDSTGIANLQIVIADADPRTSGIDAPLGSLVLLNDGTASFFKSGSLTTDWSLSLLGSGTGTYIPKFTGTGASGVIGNSSITDDGSNITTLSSLIVSPTNPTSYPSFTWSGSAYTLNTNFKVGQPTYTLTANTMYATSAVIGDNLTVASSGTHPLIASLFLRAPILNTGAGAATNFATLYIESDNLGTETVTNDYALWVDAGITRLDGTAIINGEDATTNSVKSAGYFQGSLTTGTPAVGIGTSVGFNTQTAASTYKLGTTISSAATNVGSGSEAFDFYINTMAGGAAAAERLRIRSDGRLKFNTYTSSTAWGGTPVAALMTNSTGDIITQEPVLQVTSLTINQGTVNGAFTTPVTLVAAPGAGKVIVPSILIFKLNFAAAFTTNTSYAFQIGSTTITTAKSFAQTSSIYNIDPVNSQTSVATANLANQPLQWKVQVGNSSGGLGSTISIGCIYTVMTI